MNWKKPQPQSDLEKLFFDGIEQETPDSIRNTNLLDLSNDRAFTFELTRESLQRNSRNTSPLNQGEHRSDHGLELKDWLTNYKNEARVSTGGIRGPQNPLYPWDTRYPLNIVGILLATVAKGLVANQNYPNVKKYKMAANEVRYNSKLYVELISRIQAGLGIGTLVTEDYEPVPIWLTSFIIFMLDLFGGEYVTSSHAISKKIATKDLDFEGSQFIPEESIKFVEKIEEIFAHIESTGSYQFTISSKTDPLIDKKALKSLNYGISLYVAYLKNIIATPKNLAVLATAENQIIIDCMGGSAYSVLSGIFKELGVLDHFVFLHKEPDPFFHSIGKVIKDNGILIDYGCDTTITETTNTGNTKKLPVVETMHYAELLKGYPVGTICLITDPDADRLITAEIVPLSKKSALDNLGLSYIELNADRLLVVYMPNQSFLLTLDFQYESIKNAGLLTKYSWFIIKTTASAISWDIWAEKHNIPVVNTPVGFKEIQNIMKKVEGQIHENSGNDIVIKDVFERDINLGKNPRLLFAGEESGGEIFGPPELIKSANGNTAISMREKSSGEAILAMSTLNVLCRKRNQYLFEYLEELFNKNDIKLRYELRVDTRYYNENEPNIEKLNKSKEAGMLLKAQNEQFFISIALAYKQAIIGIGEVREILTEALPQLNFANLESIAFVGDGIYFKFTDKFVEVRPSGTDAINKAYSSAQNLKDSITYSNGVSVYDGRRTAKHLKYIPEELYVNSKNIGFNILAEYQRKGLPIKRYLSPTT